MVPRLSVLLRAARAPAGRRGAVFAAAAGVVVLLHVWLLTTLAPAWIDPDDSLATAPVLHVRSVPLPPPVPLASEASSMAAAGPKPAAPPAAAPAPRARPAAPRASAPARVAQPDSPPQVAVTTVADTAPSASAGDAANAPASAPAKAAAAPAAVPAIEVPVYATRLAPAGSWRYRLQRGLASGEAQLTWTPDAQQHYAMRLEGWIAGVTVLDWVSTGALDDAGIAPQRFVIRRRGRDSQAANFQRDAGKVTFSGPTHELPLLPGVQDRLSWMLQLPAVVDAAPQRFGAGSSVVLMVVGARGGGGVWTFDVVGPESLDGAPTLKLVRGPRKLRDLRVEVWLDPAQAHLPVRALLTQPEGGAPLELTLQKGSTGP
jgi:Protein of unknown function (DUF3108)